MAKRIDLAGRRYGRLVVINRAGRGRWNCVCDCGNYTKPYVQNIKKGRAMSCGCGISETMRIKSTKHGQACSVEKNATSTYSTWSGMKERCYNPKNLCFDRYGGRGVKVCSEWHSFESFFRDMGERPKGMTIDRIDNDGNYEPGNCRWASQKQQNNNRGTYNRLLSIGDDTKTISEWSEFSGINAVTIRSRLRAGWCGARLLTPARSYGERA